MIEFMKTFKIQKLADTQESLPKVRELLESQWPDYYGPDGPGDPDAELQDGSQRAGQPLLVVAVDAPSGQAIGTGALKAVSIHTFGHLGPWLAGLVVNPDFRRRGVAEALIAAVEEEAKVQGFQELYSATHTAKGILERRGWERIDEQLEDGELFGIYIKNL
jgi:GNAT superfamily N-acetyltransferase